MKQTLNDILDIDFPIIMAPMFLVTNEAMMVAAAKAGIAGCIPALNFRTPKLFDQGLSSIRDKCTRSLGVNIIVNKSNIYASKQIEVAVKNQVDFIITSLGSPREVIEKCRPHGIKVFCDVVDSDYALKVKELGADALIAVNSGAGGHAGKIPASVLIPTLIKDCGLPVISAGGVGNGAGIKSMLDLGAVGLSIGTPFIATVESEVSNEYKQAIVDYKAKDIVVTEKISGTPCTVINTPYVQKIGTEQNYFEKKLNQNKHLKKYAKMLTSYKGMKAIEKAAFSATYKTMWCAGPSLQFVDKIQSVEDWVEQLKKEYQEALNA